MKYGEYKLCYVERYYEEESTYDVFFTTQDLKDQWGDDWNDSPYEHNAGWPYTPCWHNLSCYINQDRVNVKAGELCHCSVCQRDYVLPEGIPKWKVKVITIQSSKELNVPADKGTFNVELINSGVIAWMWSQLEKEDGKCEVVPFPPGMKEDEFKQKLNLCEGTILKEEEL